MVSQLRCFSLVLLHFVVFTHIVFAQNCAIPLFSQTYSIEQGTITLSAIRLDANNTYAAVGRVEQPNGINQDPCILKLDNLGNIIWAKRVVISQNIGGFSNLKITTDGGYIAVGVINAQPVIIKFSSTGAIQWSNISNDGSGQKGSTSDYFSSVIQTKTGEYVASGSIGLNAKAYIAKFSATGTTQWARRIGTSRSEWSLGLDEFNDGNIIVASNTTASSNTYLLKLNIIDGSTLWQKQYSSGAPNACCDHSFDGITRTTDGNFLITGNWQAGIGLLQKIDMNGNVVWTKTIQNAGQALRTTHAIQTPDGGYIVSQFDYNNQFQRTIVKFDSILTVQWVKKSGIGGDGFMKDILMLKDGHCMMLGNENNNFFLKKTDILGNTCDTLEKGRVTIQAVHSQMSDGIFENIATGSFSIPQLSVLPLSINVVNRCICPTLCISKVFIPNAFSPFTSENINDIFYPYASDCAKTVVIMQIYDRWGELLFFKQNFPLNDSSFGWHGIFNGKQLPPNVYIYRIDILLTDGRIERYIGDVTLIR